MAIKNYSTGVGVGSTVSRILKLLASRGVSQVSTDYDANGDAAGLSFKISTGLGTRQYQLPVRSDGALDALKRAKETTAKQRTPEHANRVAWRNAQDWLEAQFALVDAGMADTDEVFLPYMIGASGQTMYDAYRGRELEA